jgi:TonB family protein
MNIATRELETARRARSARCMLASAFGHAALLLSLVLFGGARSEAPGLTEITWIEPVEAATSPDPAPPVEEPPILKPKPAAVPAPAQAKEVHVTAHPKELPRADVGPLPSTLQRRVPASPPPMVGLSAPEPVSRVRTAAAAPEPTPVARPTTLTREDSPRPKPIKLERSETPPERPRSTLTQMSVPDAPAPVARAVDSSSSRSLSGATLSGAVADRPLLYYKRPDYPDWAKKQAVEATVTISFVVVPDGRIRQGVQIQKTSGFADFDDNAVAALLSWRFQPLEGAGVDQQGRVTFHFQLKDGNTP